MSSGREWELVERRLLEQLRALGWEVLIYPNRTSAHRVARVSDRDVLLEERLGAAMRAINPGPDGEPWLDDPRVNQAIAELRSMPAGVKLLEANQVSTELILGGTQVAGLDGWNGGRDQTIDYIDWSDPRPGVGVNDFLAVSQFPVATPGRAPSIRPDVTLFVNGIPLVVIEAKTPGADSAITTAIDQLRRYANQRSTAIDARTGGVTEGAEQLFWTNQFTVATTGERAEAGTFSADAEHYAAWKDPYPLPVDTTATQQQTLVAGMLAPERLLDLVRHFTLFMETAPGRTVKVVARYQQHRGVHKAIERLLGGTTRPDAAPSVGDVDRRGGIIWHTQGSGKSLTMVFLIRAMRSHPQLRHFKIVLVTDRTDLQTQLADTANLTGETIKVATSADQLRTLLAQPSPDVVMAMIQKYRTDTLSGSGISGSATFENLNDSTSILIMVDEAHRSHGSELHANLMAAVPNAARIGFTGTPIIMGKRKQTLEIFGGYLDRYTLTQSEADGTTVPIFYEGRTTDAAVAGASKMDDVFYRWFAELTDDQRDTLQQKYATTAKVIEAPELIAAKADDILRHYVGTVMPDGFKGMIVATSRKACLRYHEALGVARDALVTELDERRPELLATADVPDTELDRDLTFLRSASDRIELIRDLEFAPIISGDHNDPPDYAEWTDRLRQASRIGRFKLKLGHADEHHDPLAILIVKSMLLTGFDAPNAQVLYLDRLIQEAELLQAIARVNRTAEKKDYGLVVDYYGVSAQLTRALAAYTSTDGEIDPDVDGALRPLSAEIDKLEPQRQRVRQLFVQRGGIHPANTHEAIEACIALLADERLRAEFDVALRTFLTTFDTVLPRPAALPYVDDANLFGEIQILARRRYRDTPDGDFDPHKYKEKVRRLIDQHIVSLDLSEKIASIRITDPAFSGHVRGLTSERAKASEMEHAIRHHIREHLDEDPVFYERLSQRVDEIISRLKDRWEQMVLELGDAIADATTGRTDDADTGLDPRTEQPFHARMADRVATSDPDAADRLVALTTALVAELRADIATVGFWDNAVKQDQLRKTVKTRLDASDLFAYDALDELAVDLVDLARANRHRLHR